MCKNCTFGSCRLLALPGRQPRASGGCDSISHCGRAITRLQQKFTIGKLGWTHSSRTRQILVKFGDAKKKNVEKRFIFRHRMSKLLLTADAFDFLWQNQQKNVRQSTQSPYQIGSPEKTSGQYLIPWYVFRFFVRSQGYICVSMTNFTQSYFLGFFFSFSFFFSYPIHYHRTSSLSPSNS